LAKRIERVRTPELAGIEEEVKNGPGREAHGKTVEGTLNLRLRKLKKYTQKGLGQ